MVIRRDNTYMVLQVVEAQRNGKGFVESSGRLVDCVDSSSAAYAPRLHSLIPRVWLCKASSTYS